MTVNGPSGPSDIAPADDTQTTPAAPDAAPGAGATAPVRGVGQGLPTAVQLQVLDYDRTHHANRNIPDRSYGPVVVSSTRNDDGSFSVDVGSMPTTLFGPRPGQKPFDLTSYTFKDGQVTEAGAAPPPTGPESGEGYAEDVENLLDDGNSRGATEAARKASGQLALGGLGFPRLNPNPSPDDVSNFKEMLGDLEADNRLDDLRNAVDKDEQRLIQGFGGRRPMDWYGPAEVLSTVINKYGTDSQKAIWNAKPEPSSGTDAPGDAIAAEVATDLGKNDTKAATEAALAAGDHLALPGLGFSRIAQNPDPADLERFRSFLDQVEAQGNVNALRAAVAAETQRQLQALTGGKSSGGAPPQAMDWYGPSQVMNALVASFGSPSQKDKWGVGRFGKFEG
jgi:hypothetical protein